MVKISKKEIILSKEERSRQRKELEEKKGEGTKEEEKELEEKEGEEIKEGKEEQIDKKYLVGIYARLSVEGDSKKNESIHTQLQIIKAFIKEQKNMTIFDCYIDLGKTGKSFKREGFERMINDVRKRKINCIIVKDLSRFGRNYIETGNYIEKIFPFMGVRFIAVTDQFDSIYLSKEDEIFSVNLKNLINEMYAQDISEKVKSSKKIKREEGNYIGGLPPYGYIIERINKKRYLCIEEKTADIVKKIFTFFLAGQSMKEIIEWLYQKKIARPSEYNKTHSVYCQEDKVQQWTKGTIKKILTNPVYRNCIGEDLFWETVKKLEKTSINAIRKTKKDSSIIVSGNLLKEDIFEGLLYCSNCGILMKRTSTIKRQNSTDTEKERNYFYYCVQTNKIDKAKCIIKNISLDNLIFIVKKAIFQEISLSFAQMENRIEDIIKKSNKKTEKIKTEWQKQGTIIERKINYLIKQESEQYLKYRTGEITKESFQDIKEKNKKKKASFQQEYQEILEKGKTIDLEIAKTKQNLISFMKGEDKAELTKEIVQTFIYRIEMNKDCRIKIIFAFQRTMKGNHSLS